MNYQIKHTIKLYKIEDLNVQLRQKDPYLACYLFCFIFLHFKLCKIHVVNNEKEHIHNKLPKIIFTTILLKYIELIFFSLENIQFNFHILRNIDKRLTLRIILKSVITRKNILSMTLSFI